MGKTGRLKAGDSCGFLRGIRVAGDRTRPFLVWATQEPGAASVRLMWKNLGRSLHNCLEAGTMVSLLHR